MTRTTKKPGRDLKWVFVTWFHIGTYLSRLKIISTPFGGIYLHKIKTPDNDHITHCHPWRFVSIVLRGGYWEVRRDPMTLNLVRRRVKHVSVMRTHESHYIEALLRPNGKPTWTLVFVGRRVRTWGFWRQIEPFEADRYRATVSGRRSGWTWHEFDSDIIHDRRLNE